MIHPSAIVDPGATIGRGTRIWHFCHVMGGARIGNDCSFGQGCFVADGVRVGDRVKVQNGVSIFAGVELGDDVFLGPGMVFTNVRNPRAAVDRRHQYAQTRVARGATIGANATVLPGLSIGEFAFVAAGTVVTRDVLPHALVMGTPARRVGWMSHVGERLLFDAEGRATCPVTGDAYRLEGPTVRCLSPS